MMPSMMKGMALATGMMMIHTILPGRPDDLLDRRGRESSMNSPTRSRHQMM